MVRFFLTMMVGVFIWVASAGAQDPVTSNAVPGGDPLAAFKTEKGLISITKAAPDVTPVSDYTGDFWNRSTAFGDVLGRQKLYEMGITLDAQVTHVLQGVVSGGPEDGPGSVLGGLLDFGVTFDTAKLGLWSGGLLAADGQTNWGQTLLRKSGSISPTNFLALYPVAGVHDTVLMEYYYVQALPNNISAIVGRINAVNFLDKNRFANDPRNQFSNISMDNDPLFGAFVSFSTYAALFDIPVTDWLKIQPAIFDPDDKPGDYEGTNGIFNRIGTGFQTEFSWKLPGNLDGALRPVYIYTNKTAVDLSNADLLPNFVTGQPLPRKFGNSMVHFNFEQYLWKPVPSDDSSKTVRTASYDFEERGVGIFGRFGWAPDDRNLYNEYASAGIGGRGVFDCRPYDRFGAGMYWLKESDELKDRLEGQLLGDEYGFESFYNFAITPWLTLSGDLQWIKSGKVGTEDPVVLGLRLNTIF
jgi:carbohydrate-selective porin OprB